MKKVVLLAPVVALVLAGCAHDPTIAARVAGRSIPIDDVTIMSNFLCTAASESDTAQAVPLSVVNQTAMTYLVGAKSIEALADANHVSLPDVSGNSASIVATLPTSEQKRAQQLIDEVISAMEATGGQSTDQAQQVMVAAIQSEVAKGQVEENPAYPTSVNGDSGSLSAVVSDLAHAAAGDSEQSSADYVAALPAGQKCGD